MLDAVTTPTFKMTSPACSPGTCTDMQGNLFQVNRLKDFFSEFFFFIGWISATCRKLFISARRIMTDQTVYILFRRKIKGIIFPSISCVAAGAPAPVRLNSNSEIVENVFLADPLLNSACGLPGPVIGFMELFAGLVMTTQTGLSDLLASCKLLIKRFKFGMVRR